MEPTKSDLELPSIGWEEWTFLAVVWLACFTAAILL